MNHYSSMRYQNRYSNIVVLFFILPVLLIFLFSTPAYADFQKGLDAAQKGDYSTALEEWKPLADQGYAEAQYNLGVMYENGLGVSQDHKTAFKLWKSAAEQGHVDAQNNLGLMYYSGRGIPKDRTQAAKWLGKAAEQGNASAQYYLADMYGIGDGVPVDAIVSMKWWILAAELGDKRALQYRDFIAGAMKPAELSEAQRLAREWLERHGQ